MECNIGQDTIFLTHSEMLYFLGIFINSKNIGKYCIFILQRNQHEIFNTI
jgi:hypothetical protein